MKGTVKFFNTDKGFGFIAGEDGKDYFAHTSAVPAVVTLREGDAVSFDVTQGDRGPKAANVKMAAGNLPAAEEPAAEASDDKEE